MRNRQKERSHLFLFSFYNLVIDFEVVNSGVKKRRFFHLRHGRLWKNQIATCTRLEYSEQASGSGKNTLSRLEAMIVK